MNDLELLASVIKGDELKIEMILDKYTIGERDREAIRDTIAKIEENTYELVMLRILKARKGK